MKATSISRFSADLVLPPLAFDWLPGNSMVEGLAF
jgi:hypothetical protein